MKTKLLLFAACCCLLIAQCKTKREATNKNLNSQTIPTVKQMEVRDTIVYVIADVMPEFPGGKTELQRYIANNFSINHTFKYEPWGKAQIRYVVNQDGMVEDVVILNKIPDTIKNRLIELMQSLPKFKPGENNGKPVKVRITEIIYEPL